MTIDDIQKLIDQDESVTLELKKSTGELKDAMHTACAFLNTDGGWLIFRLADFWCNSHITQNSWSGRQRQHTA